MKNIIVLLLYFFCSYAVLAEPIVQEEDLAAKLLKVQKNDVTIGSMKAPLLMIEYSSLSCPHCAEFHLEVFPKIKQHYIDTGKLLYIIRDLPLNKPAFDATRLMNCVTNNTYEIRHELFHNQAKWAFHNTFSTDLYNFFVPKYITKEAFDKCLADKKQIDELSSQAMNAMKILHVNVTPSFFLNGKLIETSHNFADYQKLFDAQLRK